MELRVEEECTGFLIAEKAGFDSELGVTRRLEAADRGINEFGGEASVKPGFDDAIHPRPIRRGRRRGSGKNMILQRILANDEKKLFPLPCVGRGKVQHGWDKPAVVENVDGLGMKVLEGGGFMKKKGTGEVRDVMGTVGIHGGGRIDKSRGGQRVAGACLFGIAFADGGSDNLLCGL